VRNKARLVAQVYCQK
jgi:hypothetical protein